MAVEEDTIMQNSEKTDTFYADYLNGQDSMVTVFEGHRDGLMEYGRIIILFSRLEI